MLICDVHHIKSILFSATDQLHGELYRAELNNLHLCCHSTSNKFQNHYRACLFIRQTINHPAKYLHFPIHYDYYRFEPLIFDGNDIVFYKVRQSLTAQIYNVKNDIAFTYTNC